ncbi:MAG: hypothetical protein M3Z65_00795 [Chloroflexota bacterium]|nr:hypothetical protein [Chloroflexota bacterium]
MYDPALWHDYFLTVGIGAAALTGLVFVAMSMHLDEISSDLRHRHRARTILAGLTAVFIRCALVLMGGQSGQAVALEIIAVLAVVEVILYRSIREALATARSQPSLLVRTLAAFFCLIVEQMGAAFLLADQPRGLYVVGLGMMSSFVVMVSGAWLLLVGVSPGSASRQNRSIA